jgi:hypothetical protein
MNTTGSGGLGAVSAGISEALVGVVILVVVLFVVWKVVKILGSASQ